MLFLFLSALLFQSPASASPQALLSAWQQEVSQAPYAAEVAASVSYSRNNTDIQQSIKGSFTFKDRRHAKGTINVLTEFPNQGPAETIKKPVPSEIVAFMDGRFLWNHIQMPTLEFNQVIQSDLDALHKLVDQQYSGVLGMSLPFLADPYVLRQILSAHELTLRTTEDTRIIEAAPSQNLLGSVSLPPVQEGRVFTLTFPKEGFYPLEIKVMHAEKEMAKITIQNFSRDVADTDFSFQPPSGVPVSDGLKPYESFLKSKGVQ